jgi:hypothetical protein
MFESLDTSQLPTLWATGATIRQIIPGVNSARSKAILNELSKTKGLRQSLEAFFVEAAGFHAGSQIACFPCSS